MDTIERSVTRQERLAEARQVGISKPFHISLVILTVMLFIACSVTGTVLQSPWFLFTALGLFEVVFGVSFVAYEDYRMLNASVRSNRRREQEKIARGMCNLGTR